MMLFMRWLSRWPLARLHAMGAVLGWATWLLSPSYRRRLNANAALAGLGPGERRRSIAEAGRMAAEVPWLWFMPHGERLGDRVSWHGESLIEDALAAGRGLLLLTPHLGSFEVAARAAAEGRAARDGGNCPRTAQHGDRAGLAGRCPADVASAQTWRNRGAAA
jgi:KDO2-lipid IV(A) lauroyltransferase